MNRFIQAAIQNMEQVEHDHERSRPNPERCQQWTQEAIAYALIAIAEVLDQSATAPNSFGQRFHLVDLVDRTS